MAGYIGAKHLLDIYAAKAGSVIISHIWQGRDYIWAQTLGESYDLSGWLLMYHQHINVDHLPQNQDLFAGVSPTGNFVIFSICSSWERAKHLFS